MIRYTHLTKYSSAARAVFTIFILFMCLCTHKIAAQAKEYATVSPSSGRNSATFVLGLFGNYTSTSDNNRAQLVSPGFAGDGDESTAATLRARNVGIPLVGQISGEAWVQMKFATARQANSTTYVRIDPVTATGISVDLIETLGGLLGLLENQVIIPEVYSSASAGSNGTRITSGMSSTLVRDGAGNLYLAVTSEQAYNAVRVKLRNQGSLLGLSLGSWFNLNVYDAFTLSDPTCGSAVFTDLGRTTGISLSLGEVVRNPEQAIDGNDGTHSTISTGTLNLLGSAFQTFHFNGLSAPQDYFKITFTIGGGSLLDLNLLGNFEVRAYNGTEQVYSKKLQGALVNGLDLLTLLQSGNPVTVPFGPGVPFDRVAIGINTTAAVNLASFPLEVYGVERYGLGNSPLTCVDAESPVNDEGGAHMLGSNRACADVLVAHGYTNFPLNAVDGNSGTYAVMEATSGSLLGGGAYNGFVELGYAADVAAGTTSYLKIDIEDEGLLSSLLDGSLGGLLGGVLDNVLFGNHYFTIRVNDGSGAEILLGSSANAFNGLPIKIVQDKYGHFYVAVTPTVSYRSIRITEHFPALVGTEASRTMKVYGMCHATGSEDCEQAFATYSESTGLNLDVLRVGSAGVRNAYLGIDDDAASVEDDGTYAEIGIGTAGVGTSTFQFFEFHTLSSPTDYFKVKIGVENGSVLSLDLLNTIELRAYNGDNLVYSQRLQNGLVADLDILGLLSANNTVTIPIGPGVAFDRVAIGINTLVGLDVFSQVLRVYSVKRFSQDGTCPDPNPLPEPPVTETPFNTSDCGVTLGDFANVNFAANAVDGRFNSFATLSAGSGVILGSGSFDGFIEMDYNAPVPAGETSYIRIDMPEQGLLNALVAGSLGDILVDVVDNLLLGHYFFELSVHSPAGTELYSASSATGFPNNGVRLVKDAVGRYYIAFTADQPYQSVRLTLKNQAIAGLNAVSTMSVYGVCRETEFNPCEQGAFTSFGGEGLTLELIQSPDNPAGVQNPQYVIDSNNSNYAEFSLGTVQANVLGVIYQDIHFKTKVTTATDDRIRLRLQVPQTLADVTLLGNYYVYFYDDETRLPGGGALNSAALISDVDLLGFFNTGSVIGVEVAPPPGIPYNRVRFEVRSPVGVNLSNAMRLYSIQRISADCPDPDFEQPPFSECAEVIVSANQYVDDVQNLVDGNHNSYATVRSRVGGIGGLAAYSGSVELGYGAPVVGGTASYIRIGYEEDILNSLLAGSLGGLVNQVLNRVVLGDHYFEVIVKDGSGTTVVAGSSDNLFSSAGGQIGIVQDVKGRYYLKINPSNAYQSVQLIDHTTALLGLGLAEGQLQVYGMCNTPTTFACPTAFSTSWDGNGLTLDALGAGGAGVQNAFWAIDQNSSNFSTLSLGTLGVGGTVEQRIQFNQMLPASSQIGVKLSVGSDVLSADILSTLRVVGYLNGAEVFSEPFNQAFVELEADVLNLLNNGAIAELTIELPGDVDEIGIELSGLLSVGVAPNVRLYHVIPYCDAFADSRLEVTKNNAVANGADYNEVTAYVLNSGGTPVTNEEVVFTIVHVDGSIETHTATTDADGAAKVEIRSAQAGVASVTAMVGGMVISEGSPAEVTFIAGPVDHVQSTLEVTKDNALADGVDNNELTATIVDANGNVIENKSVAFDITYPNGSIGQQTVPTNADGVAVLSITSTQAGPATVTASVDGTGITGSPATVTFVRLNSLSVTKEPNQERVIAGSNTTFTVTITNNGPEPLANGSNITLGEIPSSGLSIVGYTVASNNATVTGSGNRATVTATAEVPVDGTIVVVVTASVVADAPATVSNTVQVWAPDQDPDNDLPDDEDTTDPIPVDRDYGFDEPDAIIKVGQDNGSGGIVNPLAGASYTYTVTVKNNGPSVIADGTALYFRDEPSVGQTLTGVSYKGMPVTFNGTNGTFSLVISPAVPVGDTFTFDVTVDVESYAPERVRNTIHIWQDDPGADFSSPDGTGQTPEYPVDRNYGFDDDAILKVGNAPTATAGSTYTYTVTVTNKGPSNILEGEILYFRDILSEGQTLQEINYAGAAVAQTNGLFSLTMTGEVSVGDTFSFDVIVSVAPNAPATIRNTIQIWQTNPGTENLPAPDGQHITDPIPVVRDYGLDDDAIVKVGTMVAGTLVNPVAGQPYTYTVTVTNQGPSEMAASTVLYLQDVPSAGQTLSSVTYGGTTVTPASNGRFDLTLSSAVAVGGTFTFNVTVDIAQDPPATVKNTIHVWQDNPGTDLSDPDGSAETPDYPVNRNYELSITKTADDARVVAGGSTTFTVTVTNNGPSVIASGQQIALRERPGTGVIITGYTVSSGSATVSGTGNTATLTTTGAIPVGGTITVSIAADISADAGSTITNGISVWGPGKDPDTDGPDDEDDMPDIPVDRNYTLSVTKTADDTRVVVGGSTTFTVTITNNGPSVIASGQQIALRERPGTGVIITGYTVSSGSATISGTSNTATLTTTGVIPVGGTITVSIAADISADAGSTITNGISVWGPGKDPETENPDDDDETPEVPVDRELIRAVDDQAEVQINQSITIDVLANDISTLSPIDRSTVEIVSRPLNGRVDVLSTGEVIYTPNDGFVGEDSFTYRVQDELGQFSNTATVNVRVIPKDLRIPNAFTPNGDGVNDYFVIEGIEAFDRVQLIIINRHGNEVYRNPRYDNRWDGANLNQGTYYYMLQTFRGSEESVHKGWVLIKK